MKQRDRSLRGNDSVFKGWGAPLGIFGTLRGGVDTRNILAEAPVVSGSKIQGEEAT
jgi:hypothetical protein